MKFSPLTRLRDILLAHIVQLFLRLEKGPMSRSSSRLEVAFSVFLGVDRNMYHLSLGDRIYSVIFKLFLRISLHIYGIDEKEVRELLRGSPGRALIRTLAKSFAAFGIRSLQTLSAPLAVVWSLSNRCNLRCQHCYQDAGRVFKEELSMLEQLHILDELAEAGVAMVVFSGGEPLIQRNIFTLVQHAVERGMAVSLDSNGLLIDDRMAFKLKDLGLHSVEISIDSSQPEKHDAFRGVRGAYAKAEGGVKACVAHRIFTTVATTLTQNNYQEVESLVTLAEGWGANRIVFFHLIPTGRGKAIESQDLTHNQRTEVLDRLEQLSRERRIEVFTEFPQLVLRSNNDHSFSANSHMLCLDRLTVTAYYDFANRGGVYGKILEYLGGCPAGRLYCNIQPNGDITPCMFMPNGPVAGNLRQNSFQDIWLNSDVFRRLRDRRFLKGLCSFCQYTIVCGGCRARAIASTGDYLEPDPACPLILTKGAQ